MKRAVVAVLAIIALLPASAYAQFANGSRASTQKTEEQRKQDAESEKAYNDVMKATRGTSSGALPKMDPWHTVRPEATDRTKR